MSEHCELHPTSDRYDAGYNAAADCSYCFWHKEWAGSAPETADEVKAFEHYYSYNSGLRRNVQ